MLNYDEVDEIDDLLKLLMLNLMEIKGGGEVAQNV